MPYKYRYGHGRKSKRKTKWLNMEKSIGDQDHKVNIINTIVKFFMLLFVIQYSGYLD